METIQTIWVFCNYNVDAGLIGCVLLDNDDLLNKAYSLYSEESANIVNFQRDFTPTCDNGVFVFDKLIIDTGLED